MNRRVHPLVALYLSAISPLWAGWEEGVAAFKAGNFAQAAKEFEGVVNERPDWAQGHMMYGRALLKLGRSQQGLVALRKAYDLAPSDATIQLALAQALVEANQPEEAAKLLGRMNPASLSKEQQALHQRLNALALGRSSRGERAVAELAKVAAANPNDASIQYQYGVAALNSGATAEAVGALERAARLDPRDPKKQLALTQAFVRLGRESQGPQKDQAYEKAVEAARALVGLEGKTENLMLLGEAQLGAGRYEEAVATFSQVTAKSPSEWLPHFYIGQAYTALKNYPPAIEALQAALRLANDAGSKVRIQKQLGFVFEKQGNLEQARVAYQAAGDQASVDRVVKNQEIAAHNRQAEEEERKLAELKKAQEEARKALQQAAAPPR
jgi:tetratricopeptide (TPR) repeat protein